MNYCPSCGQKLDQDYAFCPKCGHKLSEPVEVVDGRSSMSNKDHETLQIVAKVFMIISTVVCGFFLIPLCWMVPMTVHYSHCIREGRPVGIGFAICSLIFVNTISGILMIVDEVA